MKGLSAMKRKPFETFKRMKHASLSLCYSDVKTAKIDGLHSDRWESGKLVT